MIILSAKDYGFRKVVVVVHNPDDPQWIHEDGNPHTSDTAVDVNGDIQNGLAAGTQCHACRNNWKTEEVIFEGADLQLSDDKIFEKVAKIVVRPTVQDIPALIGRTVI